MIWVILLLIGVLCLSVPLLRSVFDRKVETIRDNNASTAATNHYRAQLTELKEDTALGLINTEMFTAAKLELDRRLLKSEDKQGQDSNLRGGSTKGISLTLAGTTITLSFLIYLSLGSPSVPTKTPERTNIGNRAITENGPTLLEAIERIEARLAEKPDDTQGWQLLATSARAVGDYQTTINAYESLIALEANNAEWLVKRYEAYIEMASGQVTPAARLALGELIAASPEHPAGQYYLGRIYLESGDHARAATTWQALLSRSKENAPWVPIVRQELAKLSGVAPALSNDQISTITALPAEEQQAFIESMVARLEARLDEKPDDIEGWIRLANSYLVLGKQEEAVKILNKALTKVKSADQHFVQELLDKVTGKTNP